MTVYATTISDGTSTFTGIIDMTNNRVINIGASGTDFSASGGLALADALDMAGSDVTLKGGSIYHGSANDATVNICGGSTANQNDGACLFIRGFQNVGNEGRLSLRAANRNNVNATLKFETSSTAPAPLLRGEFTQGDNANFVLSNLVALLPSTNNSIDIGNSSLKFKTGFFVTTDVGDIMFGNDFKIVESLASDEVDGIPRLYFINDLNQTIMSLDQDGNMRMAGTHTPNFVFTNNEYDNLNLHHNETRQIQRGLYVNMSAVK